MTTFSDFFDDNFNPKWDFIMQIPEFQDMVGTEHSAYWHNEGDPMEHTKLVVNCMKDHILAGNNYPPDDINKLLYKQQALMMAALFHDIAKPVVTKYDEKKGDWTAPYHAEIGARMTRIILMRMDYANVFQRELVVSLVRVHMRMHHIADDHNKIEKKLFDFVGKESKYYDSDMLFCSYLDAEALCLCDDMSSWCKDESFVKKYRHHIKRQSLQLMQFDDGFKHTLSVSKKRKIAQEKIYGRSVDEHKPFCTVYVMIGLPGSGKSTFVKNNLDFLPCLSRDIIRIELGFCKEGEKYIGTKEEEEIVTKTIEERMVKYAENLESFVVDNTHMKQAYRDRIHEILKDYNIFYHYIYIEAPTLKENIRRREVDGFGIKSSEIILNMLDKFEFPYPYEFDCFEFYKEK